MDQQAKFKLGTIWVAHDNMFMNCMPVKQSCGFYPSHPSTLYPILEKVISDGDYEQALDLGAGTNLPGLLMAHYGVDSLGIEIDSELCEKANRLIALSRNLAFINRNVSCEVV